MRRIALLLSIALLSAATIALPRTTFAQTLDVIRGRVTGPDSQGVQGVTVKATSYSGNVAKTTRTDKNGKYSITYPSGEGDYWLEFAAMGYQPKRFEVKRVADEPILLADTKLSSSIATLDAVNVKADGPRALINRNASGQNVGGGEKSLTNTNVPPDQMGNLAAMAASLPGIQLIPGLDGAADVFSALGLSADQNATTFNGLGSGISALPADAQVQASVLTYSYDPAIGNFSGARIQLNTLPGSNFSNRQASSNARAPQLEFADDVAQAQNQKFTDVSLGAGGRGPITMDRNFYNSSVQFGRRYQDLPSLLNTSTLGLNSAGVARDSVTRLLDILSAKGIPAFVSGAPSQQIRDNITLLNNIDISPSTNGTGNGITVGIVGNYSKSQQVVFGNSILTTPGHNGEAQNWTGLLSLKHSNYFWDSFLSTTNAGFSFSGNDNSPYLRSPSGSVRINSLLEDSTSAVRVLSFGGNPFLDNTSRSYIAEITNNIQWYAGNNRHSVKLTSDLRQERFTADQNSNTQGSFSFNSLANLQSGAASSFTRTLFAPRRQGSQLNGAFSLGDTWRPNAGSGIFWLQYGLRLDFNHLLDKPLENPLIEQKLGVRNDVVPNKAYFSPRVGFTWIYGKQDQIAFIPGAARPPRALIQGGIGVFQNINGAQLLSNAINNTGLASSTQSLTCLGPAAPVPNWSSYGLNPSAIPSTCADGTAGSNFSNTTPNVSLFSPNYQQQRVWRSNLNWGGPIFDNS
ncbi:MAG: carboxypeptidase-like regulatory domain-containing protein, partial [Gemmatimonadota bacterium]|nr:carboxypeptidase-like regulatory domain-containing protein [Gemmatimonadota bacterium]